MKLTSQQLKDLKRVELDILVVILDICEKLHLRHYLLGGTLLGAVRHQGFIPWDDDIDIGMTREDYNVFLAEAPALLPEHLFLQTIWTDPGYVSCFAKVRNSNTTFVESPVAHRQMNHGVFVDIFPLDYYPEGHRAQQQLIRKKRFYEHRIVSEYHLPYLRFKHKLYYNALRILAPSLKKVLRKQEKLFCSVPKSGKLANYGGYVEETAPIEWYGDGVTVVFEGMPLTAPTEYDKLLTQIYGDYMTPPPEDKREGHHYVDVIDLDKPYTEYMQNR